jgi:transposase
MLSQEEFMDLCALKRQGLSNREIASQLGYHPATIGKWLRAGGPPEKRAVAASVRVLDERWAARVDELLAGNGRLLSTSLFDLITAEGYTGSYPTLVRYVRRVRGPRFRPAAGVSVPIETAPGEEAQFDWSDCSDWAARWGWDDELWCFGMILCWSRWRTWWFTGSIDRQHTFEGIVRHLEAAGGAPGTLRTDRMGALGRSQGRRFVLHPPTLDFARHHGVKVVACQSGDAKRKGKVERPFRQLKEAFLEELQVTATPATLGELNALAEAWLDRRVHAVAHRATGVPPAERLTVERGLLVPLGRRRFDTAYVAVRRVGAAVPLVEWDGARYSVPPNCLGQTVEVRREVDAERLAVRWAGVVVASHRVAPAGSEVWDPTHRQQAEAAALGRHGGRRLHAVPDPVDDADAEEAARLDLGGGDYDIDVPDLDRYQIMGCECAGGWRR